MPAARALKLAIGALSGAKELTPQQVRERVAGRYPEAEPLPVRSELDALLEDAGSELKWQPDAAGGKGTADLFAVPAAQGCAGIFKR
jgi:hypothetical protein